MSRPESSPSSYAPLQRLQEALEPGAGLVLVGGAVRDRLLGRTQGDWDLATALLPQEAMTRAKRAGLRVIPTGLQHGTVTVMLEGRPVELTTYRGDDAYLDGRRPVSVRLGVSLEEDLARRDFTVNAMALPVVALDLPDWQEHLVDPFGGQIDLVARVVRAVGDPLRRFAEDGLRPLRACRFVSQLDFELDSATAAAIPERLDVARKVAVERVHQEMTKLLCGQSPAKGLRFLAATGLLDVWFPELRPLIGCLQNRHHRLDVWEHTLAVLETLPADPGLRWAGLLHDSGKPASVTVEESGERHFYGHEALSLDLAQNLLGGLRASRALIDDVAALVRCHGQHPEASWSDSACRRHLRRLAEEGLTLDRWAVFRQGDLAGRGFLNEAALEDHSRMVARLQALASAHPPLAARNLALDGRALMAMTGRKGGPWLGELQRHLLEAVLENPDLNTPPELTRLVQGWLASTSQ